jgi:tRNA (cytidine/uridine-2'-O-)-methyltransferase
MNLVLFQPEIPQNVGTLIRFSACMGIPLSIIEPCGFLFTDKHLKRAALDYEELASVERFLSWELFRASRAGKRLIAVTSHTPHVYTDFSFEPSDCLIMGQESKGLPPEILGACIHQVSIPMMPGRRSYNLALSAAMVSAEALRQTSGFPRG